MSQGDNCERCARLDPWKTSCYGDACVCNPMNVTCAGAAEGSRNTAGYIWIIVGIVSGILAFGVIGIILAIKREKIVIQNKTKKVHQVEEQNEVSKEGKFSEGSKNLTWTDASKNSKTDVEAGIPTITKLSL